MDGLEFFGQARDPAWWRKYSVYWFIVDQPAPLFFLLLLRKIRALGCIETPHRYIASEQLSAYEASLYQTILGERAWWWLGDLGAPSKQLKGSLRELLVAYRGPHSVVCSSSSDDAPPAKRGPSSLVKIEITAPYGAPLLEAMATFFEEPLLTQLVKNKLVLLDHVCLLLHYARLMPSKEYGELTHYLAPLFESEQSFFTLAGYFFERKAIQFYRLWGQINHQYSELFWVTFWAEQLWRAYYVIHYLGRHNTVAAREIGRRLPFSFIRQGWQATSMAELAAAHELLYRSDYRIKHGSAFPHLDFMYAAYFAKKLLAVH